MTNESAPDYITYGRTFENYRWYKPILTILLTTILFILFNAILFAIGYFAYGESFLLQSMGTYESLNTINFATISSYLSLALALPSIYIASRIVRDRPFSSYSSSRGGWNWKMYFKCLIPAIIIFTLATIAIIISSGDVTINNQFTIVSFIACLIVVPLQCIGEEHLFRGLLMQSIGSWVKIPVVAIIIQSVIFGMMHAYNSIGVVSIIISGLLYGWIAWKTNGIESSSALHTVNNVYVVMLAGFGLQQTSSTVTPENFILDIIIQITSVMLVYYIGKRYGWFEC
ncbi:CPBP family intramembrane glutamic endopeptidase [Methanobrevibacter sp.]